MRRASIIPPALLLLLLACRPAQAFDAAAYDRALQEIEQKRQGLHDRWQKARGKARAEIVAEARATVVGAIIDTVFPAWIGMPWGLGRNSTATRPFEPGKVVGCSYFLTGVLLNAGLRLSDRGRFVRVPSLWAQEALSPAPGAVHRFVKMPLAALERRIAALGDGLYIVGLNIHTGFIYVRAGRVHVVHASYMPPQTVVDEPLAESQVIALSAPRGWIVSPLFQDDRLVELWLAGKPVPISRDWR